MAEIAVPEEEKSQADEEVIRVVGGYFTEAREGKKERMRLSRRNREAYHNRQDWSHKIEGQSKEFLPKTSEATEQFAAFIKRGLTQFGDWFSVEVERESPLTPDSVRAIIKSFISNLPDGAHKIDFSTRLTDAIKVALLESLMVFKVHGFKTKQKTFKVENGKLKLVELQPWSLQIDLIPPEDYYPDPTGRGLYEIHEVERDLIDLDLMTEDHNGPYRKSVVEEIRNDFKRSEEERRKEPNKKETTPPTGRHRVVLRECWGTLIKPDGSLWMDRVLCTIANEKYLIRSPEPFPYWHGESPFVVRPIMRVPFSVWHKAVYDQVVPINFALNEMFNLMLDGGIASVWGTKQLRSGWLEDARQVSGGIPQGKTLVVKDDMPEGMKVLENVTEGQVPPDAMAMYGLLNQEHNAAAFTNEVKLGNIPSKQVKATEIVESNQTNAALVDSITSDVEKGIEEIIRKSFLVILQNLDDVSANSLMKYIPARELLMLSRMTQAERFAMFAGTYLFRVFGLSATLARGRDFPKIMALMQVSQQSPLLAPVMLKRMSGDKLWDFLLKTLNMNPQNFEPDAQEQAQLPARLALFQQLNQAGGEPQVSQPTGEAGLPSEIHQNTMTTGGT